MAIFDVGNLEELYYQIGKEKINLSILNNIDVEKDRFVLKRQKTKKTGLTRIFPFIRREKEKLILENKSGKLEYEVAECCHPIPGDEIFGYAVAGGAIRVHKINCPKAINIMSKFTSRVMQARWTDNEKVAFLTHINLKGIDDIGIVNKITRIISEELNVNMQKLSFDSHDGIFDGKISLFIQNANHLDELIDKIKRVNGIISIHRVENLENDKTG